MISKSGHYYDYFSPTLRVFLESKWKWFLFAGGRIIKYPPKMPGGSSFSGFRDHASFRSCVCWLNSLPLNQLSIVVHSMQTQSLSQNHARYLSTEIMDFIMFFSRYKSQMSYSANLFIYKRWRACLHICFRMSPL